MRCISCVCVLWGVDFWIIFGFSRCAENLVLYSSLLLFLLGKNILMKPTCHNRFCFRIAKDDSLVKDLSLILPPKVQSLLLRNQVVNHSLYLYCALARCQLVVLSYLLSLCRLTVTCLCIIQGITYTIVSVYDISSKRHLIYNSELSPPCFLPS